MPNWTKEQEKAIYEPSGKKNILVSAAAGSGKTAVLVERIVNLITNSENPFPIDSIGSNVYRGGGYRNERKNYKQN